MTPVAARSRGWLRLSLVTGALAAAGSLVALVSTRIYGGLTEVFLPQAVAQDIVNLAVVTPALVLLVVLALRGSLRAYLLWLGVVTFTVYNYVIYVVAIPFGPLFFVWVAVLGLSVYTLVGGLLTLDPGAVRACFARRRVIKVVAWTLIVVALCFSLLWLKEDVAATLGGETPQSVVDVGAPTNPVHVLDLAVFLPAAFAAGVLLLRDRPLGYLFAPGLLVFLILTGLPVIVTPFVTLARDGEPAWRVLVPIGALTVALSFVLWRFARAVAPGSGDARRQVASPLAPERSLAGAAR